MVALTADLTAKIKAGDIIKHIAPIVGSEVPAARSRAGGEPQRARERAEEARAWVFDESADGLPFSFVNECETLGFHGKPLRARVRERLAEKQAA